MNDVNHTTKAQAQQIFIFILSFIITAGIIIYGYTAIKDFTGRQKQVEFVTFKTQLQNEFSVLLADYGSIKRPVVSVPSQFDYVCIVDIEDYSSASSSDLCISTNPKLRSPLACEGWKSKQGNVFLIPDGSDYFTVVNNNVKIAVPPTSTKGGYICFKNKNGKLTMQLKSLGDKIEVSDYSG